jgi:hypothetical protein
VADNPAVEVTRLSLSTMHRFGEKRGPRKSSYRFDTVLRGGYREFSRKNAMPCEGLRNADHAAKLLTEKNFRGFRHGTESIFPSWTSWVRIPSPAFPFVSNAYENVVARNV